MKYRLVYTARAVKDIKKLDTVAKRRLKKAIEKLALDPLGFSTKLIDHKLGEYRYRIGNYRVIFDLIGKETVFLRVEHRRDVYG